MGVWSPHTKTGTAHFAEHEEVPAKKIWSWGVDADGLDWRKALSDDNSGYLEVQAGLFRNQETYAFLEPRQAIHFTEYWMPVREIGGISRANRAGVVHLSREAGNLQVGFNTNQAIPQASVSILKGREAVLHEQADLTPERAWIHEVRNAAPDAKYTIEIADAKGGILLRQTEGEYDSSPASEIHVGPQASYRIPVADKRSYDDWIQLGRDDELNGRNLDALEDYKQALTRFPDGFAAGKGAGRLAAALLRYEEAKAFLEPLHARDTTDTEISYYLGLAYDGLGDIAHARAAYEQAERLPAFHSAAALRLGELLARSGDLHAAESHLSEAHRIAPDDPRSSEELAAVRNATGKSPQGLGQEGLKRFPLSVVLQEETGSPNLTQLANDSDRVLKLAAAYMRLGLYEKAVGVLSRKYPSPIQDQQEPGALAPQNHTMVGYFRAYCREKLGQSASEDYKAASTLSTAYVFPNTAEEFTVLRTALQANPSDATAHYLLGTFYFSRGMTDPALSEWAEARKSGTAIPVLSASTGLALLHVKNDPERALSAFRDGLQSDPDNIAIYLGIDQSLSLTNSPAKERVAALEKYPKMDSAPPGLIFEWILNLAEAGDFERATSLFHNRFFPREEGGTNVRQVWIEEQVLKAAGASKQDHCAEALATANQLGSEVPGLAFTRDGLEPFVQSARTNYLLGSVYEVCGKAEEAKAKFALAATASTPDQIHWAWMAARKIPGFSSSQWQDRLQASFEAAASRSETSGFPSWWMYVAGSLAKDLKREKEADYRFRQALLLPDRMLAYHFTRVAMAEAKP